jgi:hypothetical protein
VQPERAGFIFNPPQQVVPTAGFGVNFELESAFIAGRVLGAGGAGIAGVTVGGNGFSAATDANGGYRLAPLGTGKFHTLSNSLRWLRLHACRTWDTFLGDTNANFTAASFPVSGRVDRPCRATACVA